MTSNRVHLVGSVPLNDADQVFRLTAAELADLVQRMPDGETGERSNWIQWQFDKLASCPQLAPADASTDYGRDVSHLTIDDHSRGTPVEIPNLGYRDAALASYATFRDLKDSGVIPKEMRFQVCLPTPLAPISLYIALEARPDVETAYQAKLFQEVQDICNAISHDELAIQWDTAVEFGILEGVFPSHLDAPMADIVRRLITLGEAIPTDVELGYHLCYGDAGHRHFVEPQDSAKLVAVANAVAQGLSRPITWIHLPVPVSRDDDAYFQPLEDLALNDETELYLGLLHMSDGQTGAARRIATAHRFVDNFGVATECGFGRRPPDTVPALMHLHAAVVAATET